MKNKQDIFTYEEDQHLRIDRFLAQRYPSSSRAQFQFFIENGFVLVNQCKIKKHQKLQKNDQISIEWVSKKPQMHLEPSPMNLEILYEDDFLLVINKPPFLSVHPGAGTREPTLIEGVLAYTQNLANGEDELRPGIVHRLDKDTSGAIIIAKDDTSLFHLSRQFQQRDVQKTYIAVCQNSPRDGTYQFLLTRNPHHRKQYVVSQEKGKNSITDIEILDKTDKYTLVKIVPKTGRTHQIRVVLSHLKAPIIGDTTYHKKHPLIQRQLLHAYQLSFVHPHTHQKVNITAPLPEDFLAAMTKFHLEKNDLISYSLNTV